MSAPLRPPTEPRAYFEDFLPRAHAEALAIAGPAPFPFAVQVDLEGEGGGRWVVKVEGETLEVLPDGQLEDADLRIRQSVEDFRALHAGELGGPTRLDDENLPRPTAVKLDPKIADTLRRLRGTVRFLVTGFRGGDWEVWFHLGPGEIADTPRTTFRIGSMDLEELQAGEIDPQRLLMGGVLRVDGDFALAGQLAALAARQLQAIGLGPKR